ncbi:MAG: PEP-CTERM sorting domain-containing protein [Burkholderiales bacterium]|jgi:hypothetical protein|nr:PEP-CTERM sorting domain-containing protein [Burkholderiales bacterium]
MKKTLITVALLTCFSSWVPVNAAIIPVGTKIKWERNEIKSEQTVPAGAKYKIIKEDGSTFEGVTSTEFTFKNQKKTSSSSIATVVVVVGDPLVTIEGYQNLSDLTVTYDFTGLNTAIPEFTWYSVDVSYEGLFSLDIDVPSDPLSGPSTITRFQYDFSGSSSLPIAIEKSSGLAVTLGDFRVRTYSPTPLSSSVSFLGPLEGIWDVSLLEELVTPNFQIAPDSVSDPQPILEVTDKDGLFKSVPEPSSILSFLALGTLGAASTLKRKLKP